MLTTALVSWLELTAGLHNITVFENDFALANLCDGVPK